jgi:hypothetical protein
MQTTVQFPLDRGEKLLWSGAPKQGFVLRGKDVLLIPFSLLWGGFAVYWETMAITGGAPWFFRLWGIPFVLVGTYVTFGRFFYDAWRRSHTTYGLTSERAIIARSGPFPNLQSINLRTATDINLAERADGTGTIAFGRSTPRDQWGSGWGGTPSVPSFEMIPDAKRVYGLVCEAQRTPAA